jgi:hypothetical protein
MGTLKVIGTLKIMGTLKVIGTLKIMGTLKVIGELKIMGIFSYLVNQLCCHQERRLSSEATLGGHGDPQETSECR